MAERQARIRPVGQAIAWDPDQLQREATVTAAERARAMAMLRRWAPSWAGPILDAAEKNANEDQP